MRLHRHRSHMCRIRSFLFYHYCSSGGPLPDETFVVYQTLADEPFLVCFVFLSIVFLFVSDVHEYDDCMCYDQSHQYDIHQVRSYAKQI